MYYWIHVIVAALMMVATFPGRTQGLGMVTESLLRDFQMDRTLYASYNLWATLLGSLFCLPIGYWIDRSGCRTVLAVILTLLGFTVIGMSFIQESYIVFFVALTLTRGLGQSALSVASIALVSKYVPKHRLSPAMGVYSLLITIFFIVAFGGMGAALQNHVPWRNAWCAIGIILLIFVPIVLLLVRRVPTEQTDTAEKNGKLPGISLREAFFSPAFWVFGLSASFYGLVVSGIGLFNESILAERGFDTAMYHRLLVLPIPFGLLCNVLTGWLCRYISINRVLAGTLFPMSAALSLFPFVQTETQIYAYAIVMGMSGGAVTVLFFSAWGELFGSREVGQIQSIAQMLTVFASALGPLLFALSWQWTQSYTPIFLFSGTLTCLFAILACRVKRPEYNGVTGYE